MELKLKIDIMLHFKTPFIFTVDFSELDLSSARSAYNVIPAHQPYYYILLPYLTDICTTFSQQYRIV